MILNDILFLSFTILFSYYFTRINLNNLIHKFGKANITGIDQNKNNKPQIPEMGGIPTLFGFMFGVYFLIFLSNHNLFSIDFSGSYYIYLFCIVGIAIVGIIDDLVSLRQSVKALLPFIIALPLVSISSDYLQLPFFGKIFFGNLTIIIIPLAITCASNSMNMLEGFNGLGSGLGILISVFLIILCFLNSTFDAFFLLIPLLGSLISFYHFNKYPAKIFPGDSLTLFLGATFGCAALISDLKFELIVLMLPMIIEFFLKFRGNFKAQCFATKIENGKLIYTDQIESLTHFFMKRGLHTEKSLVRQFYYLEIILGVILIVSHDYV